MNPFKILLSITFVLEDATLLIWLPFKIITILCERERKNMLGRMAQNDPLNIFDVLTNIVYPVQSEMIFPTDDGFFIEIRAKFPT